MKPYDLIRIVAATYTQNTERLADMGFEEYTNSDKENCSKHGYYGIAVVNHKTKTLVISSSGVHFVGFIPVEWQDIVNVLQVYNGQAPSQHYYASLPFVTAFMNKFVTECSGYKIIVTGHSLGGVLAQLMAVELKIAGCDDVEAIVFDSPGVKEIANSIFEDIDIDLSDVDITTYNASPNLANTLNNPLGRVYQVRVENEISKLGDFVNYTSLRYFGAHLAIKFVSEHMLKSFRTAFDKTTGNPKICQANPYWPLDIFELKSEHSDFPA